MCPQNTQELFDIPSEIDLNQDIYFPTQVYTYQLPHDYAEKLCPALIELVYEERNKDGEGIERSNIRELGGWHSHNDLHRDESYLPVVDLIHAIADKISSANGYDQDYDLRINTMWSIINPPGCSNRAHIHPESLWSGVFYLQAPEKSGDFEFVDPRTEHLMNGAHYIPNKGRPQNCWTEVFYTPKVGKLLVFPSWLYHSVTTNLSQEKGDAGNRIIISFNLDQRKR